MVWDKELYTRLRGEREISGDQKTTQIVKILPSPIARGKVLNINWGTIPRGIEVITSEAVKGTGILEFPFGNLPLLASEEVHYLGQPLALVCGDDEAYLQDFLDQVDVDTEKGRTEYFSKTPMEDQILLQREWERGDVKEIFAQAHQIVEGEYRTPHQIMPLSAKLGAIAQVEDERIHLNYPSAWQEMGVSLLSKALGLSSDRLTLSHGHQRYPWDADLWFPHHLGALAALAAEVTNRSCRLTLNYNESWYYGPRRAPAVFHIKTALNKEDQITALEVDCAFDMGAYNLMGEELLDRMILGATGLFYSKHMKVRGQAVKTSTIPKSPFNGLGLVQGSFARELHFSRLAEQTHQDPWNMTRDHLKRTDHRFAGGAFSNELQDHFSVMDYTARQADLVRKFAAFELTRKRRLSPLQKGAFLRGIGFSSGFQGNGLLYNMPLQGPIELSLKVGGLEIAPHPNLWNPLLSEELIKEAGQIFDLEPEGVDFLNRDNTDMGPQLSGRNISVVYNQILQGFSSIHKKRFREGLPLNITKRYRRSKKRAYQGESLSGLPFHDLSWGSAAVEVEIDPLTLSIGVKDIWITVNPGRVLDKKKARDSLHAGIMGALSWTLYEEPYPDNPELFSQIYGRPQPPVRIYFQSEDKKAPKGLSDLPWILIPAALTFAVNQALGIQIDSLPLTEGNIKKQLEKI